MGGPLPATPETYLALRASRQDLRALPMVAFETLIADTANAALAGVVAHLISDVLGHNAADAGTPRQYRLVVALLNASTNWRKLPLRPQLIARLVGELVLHTPGKSALDALPLQAAAHALRVLLKYGGPSELIHALVDRLSHDTTFPFVEEALFIIEHTLRNGGDANTVLPLLARMVSVDGARLGEETLAQARADGSAWEKWAGTHDFHDSSLRIILWSLCCRAWLRLNRYRRFQSAVDGLQKELEYGDKKVSRAGSPSQEILRTLFQIHLVNLACTGSRNSVRAAVHALCSTSINVSPSTTAIVCKAAVDLGLAESQMALLRAPGVMTPDVFHAVGWPAIAAMIDGAAAANDTATVREIITLLGENYAGKVPSSLRAQILAGITRAQLADEAEKLYLEWSHSQGPISEEELHTLERPWMHGTYPARHKGPHSGEPVTTTPRCIVALVRLFSRGSESQRKLAHVVRDDFMRAIYRHRLRTHEQLTALVQVSFLLGHVPGAMHAMGEIIHRKELLDMQDMVVLLGGIMYNAPEVALHIFFYLMRGDEEAGTMPVKPTPTLYAALIAKAIAARRIDIALALHMDLSTRGCAPGFAREAPHLVVTLSMRPIRELVSSVIGMLREGWRPSAAHYSWVVRCVLRGLRPVDALRGMSSHRPRHSHVRAAVRLFVHGVTTGTADLPTARLLLLRLRMGTASQSLAMVDQVVNALRRAPELSRRHELAKLMRAPDSGTSTIPPALADLIADVYTTLGDHCGAHEAASLKDPASCTSRTKMWWATSRS